MHGEVGMRATVLETVENQYEVVGGVPGNGRSVSYVARIHNVRSCRAV